MFGKGYPFTVDDLPPGRTREKLEALELPEAARKEVDREMSRLERMGPEGMEAQVIRTYLETITELPWSERSEERLDVTRAADILEEEVSEDFALLTGTGSDGQQTRLPILVRVRQRMPLMGLTVLAGLASAKILAMALGASEGGLWANGAGSPCSRSLHVVLQANEEYRSGRQNKALHQSARWFEDPPRRL